MVRRHTGGSANTCAWNTAPPLGVITYGPRRIQHVDHVRQIDLSRLCRSRIEAISVNASPVICASRWSRPGPQQHRSSPLSR